LSEAGSHVVRAHNGVPLAGKKAARIKISEQRSISTKFEFLEVS